MLEALRSKYPDQLDLPSETEIRQRITGLKAEYKKHGTIVLTNREISEPFRSIIIGIVEESQYTIKLKDAVQELKTRSSTEQTNFNELLSNSKIKSFVSALKSKHKGTTK